MKAMILAAGRGERMRPLTDHLPKPLLEVGGKPLIVWHIERLVAAGVTDLVINHAHLGNKLVEALGDGAAFGAAIRWSAEPPGALETAGGIAHAMPLLGARPFIVINGDTWCDVDVAALQRAADTAQADGTLAHLLLVPNPPHHPDGDFTLVDGQAGETGGPKLTFSGVAAYHPSMFAALDPDAPAKLAPLLRAAMRDRRVTGALHTGHWFDVGTPQRLADVDALVRSVSAR
ncbi:N-acetylmuramate alpha-1-phosphate uridylyltransferase MurU [Methyloversatilis sp.]|uniref:N-acetylmuramate alpha-1-phosphate uridylyltransferase MurU n=1 Tax=Methyloversatilis sp. TaxID=2569862 RepID=UPI0027346907|nr:nucleotidyltransferase family protein [Methyloversatilis sp.]MDP2870565.1 nucleotidyltransferase family protein [Methyloversatilis sp.]MDP3288609.1 nucleotidyltransferase family protein [Methyloversatilis sp.]MDP3457578.1 nucleotidyltransferase family protein [Methyloversatilis sp.]MDP3578416.1 nucleotidyltransferase family protein [Methyloversatilis sp.]